MAFLLFAACTPQPGALPDTGAEQTPEAERSLENTIWVLVSFGETGAETPVIESSTIWYDDGQGVLNFVEFKISISNLKIYIYYLTI